MAWACALAPSAMAMLVKVLVQLALLPMPKNDAQVAFAAGMGRGRRFPCLPLPPRRPVQALREAAVFAFDDSFQDPFLLRLFVPSPSGGYRRGERAN